MQTRMTVPDALKELNKQKDIMKCYQDSGIGFNAEKFIEAVNTINHYHALLGELVNVLSEKIGE